MAFTNIEIYSGIFITILVISVIIYITVIKENFVSLGTIIDMQSKYEPGSYMYAFNMSTRETNRGGDIKNDTKKDIPASLNDDAYCFGSDFYDNGKCGEVFIDNDFEKNKNNIPIIYTDQYTGDYVNFPNVDVMRPLSIYPGSLFRK